MDNMERDSGAFMLIALLSVDGMLSLTLCSIIRVKEM